MMISLSDLGVSATTGQYRVRCPKCEGRRKTLSVDIGRGLFHCFRCGWSGRIGNGKAWYAEHAEQIREAKKQRQSERLGASRRAWEMWRAAKPAGDHPYLVRKGLPGIGLRERDGKLLVPMVDAAGTIWNVQTILADATKRFLKGGRVRGCFFEIPSDGCSQIYVCEGVATGLALHVGICVGAHVYCAFSAGNLLPVAQSVRALYPRRDIYVAADNDRWTTNNPGLHFGREAARAIGGVLRYPHFEDHELASKPTDWADAYQIARGEGHG